MLPRRRTYSPSPGKSVNQCNRHSSPDIDMEPDMVSWADRRSTGPTLLATVTRSPLFAKWRGAFHSLAWQQLVNSGSELATLVSGKTKLEQGWRHEGAFAFVGGGERGYAPHAVGVCLRHCR